MTSAPAPFQRLLVASDGNSPAAAAIRVAQLLAARDGARVDVVGVMSPRVSPPSAAHTVSLRIERRHRARAAALRTRISAQLRDAGVDWPVHVRIGQTPWIIRETARSLGAELVIVGHAAVSHVGLRRPGRHIAEQLACACDAPILAVRHATKTLPRVAVHIADGSEVAERAEQTAVRLMGVTGQVHTWSQPITKQVLDFARTISADLVAVPLTGPDFAVRSLLSGCVIDLLDHAECSVLVAPGAAQLTDDGRSGSCTDDHGQVTSAARHDMEHVRARG